MRRILARWGARAAALLVVLFVSVHAAAQGNERAANANRLAALAERIAKLHLQMAQGVHADRSRRALAAALREFDVSLLGAVARAPNPEARDNHLLLGLLWEEYRVWAAKPPTRESARKLADRADEVAWVAAKGVRMLSSAADGALALEASRACVLSQRVPRLHLMRRWDPRNEELARELAASSEELARTLTKLAAASRNTPEIAAQIQVAETQHGFLVHAAREIQKPGASVKHAENIAKTGDHILETMERVTRLYEALGL